MHARNRTLAVSLSASLLMGCASAPSTPPDTQRAAFASRARPSTQQAFFANIVAAVAAMGGNNPNPAYRAMSAQATGARRCRNAEVSGSGAPLDCARIAAAK
jgi:hypothetical protein